MPLQCSPGLHTFNGGLKLKQAQNPSTQQPLLNAPIPDLLILPLQQQSNRTAVCVNPGDYVLKGQVIAEPATPESIPLHAPTSGSITAIHPCILLAPDKQDRWSTKNLSCQNYKDIPRQTLIEHIRAAGILGLGGAGFPSHIKLNSPHPIDTLLINAAECEPDITCDDMLIRQHAQDILTGIDIMRHCLRSLRCIIGIEDCMQTAHAALQTAIIEQNLTDIQLIIIPTRYPSGGERQLIKVITGKEVPANKLPADIGILCHNVATAAAIYRAVMHGEPLLSRITTFNGNGIRTPRNLHVLIGTPIASLIPLCGGYTQNTQRLIMGGPMMGYTLPNDASPILKTSNCIMIINPPKDTPPAKACIRCGLCEEACPANLLPQQLHWYAKARDTEQLYAHQLLACIECGCCAYVCPSEIPLVQQYRDAKTLLRDIETEQQKAAHAQQRHTARQRRLGNIQRQQQETLEQKRQSLNQTNRDELQAILARAKAKKTSRSKSRDQG